MSNALTNPENVTVSAEHSDAITATASPRPWCVEPMFNGVADARGEKIAANISDADAALIVDAVNNIDRIRDELDVERSQHCTDIEQAEYHAEHHRKSLEAERDRLRDIVRRFCDLFTPETIHPAGTMERLLREARDAIGEDKP